jgi:cell wall-associated NlpC family hydrolase
MYYFDDIDNQQRLKTTLDSWLGTPYKHHIGVKGRGCDCIHFVARVLQEIKLLPASIKKLPDYPRDWHLHNTRELLMETIPKYLQGEKIDIGTGFDDFRNGDLILSHYGKAASHAGIYYDGYVYQSLNNTKGSAGVLRITINDPVYRNKMKYIYRIIK